MIVRLRAASEAVRNSLFFVPVLCVLFGLALAAAMLEVDRRVHLEPAPSVLRFTVESARELLGTVAAAIITVSGIVFALTGLSVQLASSQFSPRVVRGFLRDRSAQVSIGFMVGTFTYSLVVLRAVRSVEGGPDVVPALSTALALGLAVAAVVVVVGFVSRTGHRLQSSQLIRGVSEETFAAVASQLPDRAPGGGGDGTRISAPPEPEWRVRARSTGWVAQISTEKLLDVLPPGGVARVEVQVGRFVHPGRRLCTVWGEAGDRDKLERRVNRAFDIEMSRTMQQDIGFGIRQIVDIALRALSPGVNDPTTAQECIVHLEAISYQILRRDLPPLETAGDGGRRVVVSGQLSHAPPHSTRSDRAPCPSPAWGRHWRRPWRRSSPISPRTASSIATAQTRSSAKPGSSLPASKRPNLYRRMPAACETLLRDCSMAVMNGAPARLRTMWADRGWLLPVG